MSSAVMSSMVVSPSFRVEWPQITHGSGIYLWDTTGRRYIDGSGCASAVSSIGHGSQRIAQVMAKQASTIAVTPTHQFANAEVEAYCRELVAFGPDNMQLAWTATSGSDAVENAIKMAIQYHWIMGDRERTVVLGRQQSWHGATLGVLGVGGNLPRREPFEDVLFEAPTVVPPYCYRSPLHLEDANCAVTYADDLVRVLEETGPERVAAFVVEPVVGATLGAVVPPVGYMTRIREICDDYGVLLIADEVLTGAGRTGLAFAVDHEQVEPDLIAFGKGFSGGYIPLSGVVVSQRVAAPYIETDTPFMSGHTHACSPITAAVGREVLVIISELLDSGQISNTADRFQTLLRERVGSVGSVGDVRGIGMLAGIEFVTDRLTKRPYDPSVGFLDHVVRAALDRGLVTYPGRGSAGHGLGEHIKLAPPLTTTIDEVEEIVDILAASIRDAEQQVGAA
jgi:adenosylmethionine-8-amino-7-oxononanoate aminotransferase